MIDEYLVTIANDARLVNAADHIIYPLIKKLSQERINLASSKFMGGEVNFVADIAYIQALKDIENHLKRLVTSGNRANSEMNKEQL